MATCNSISFSGIPIDCGTQSGGLKSVFLIPTTDVTGTTVGAGTGDLSGTTSNVISAIGLSAGKKFSQYSFRKGNADYSFKTTRDVKLGTVSVMTTINLQFNRMEASKRNELEAIVGANSYVMVLDNNGRYWLIGEGSYVDVVSLDGQSGAELKDGNFYKLVLNSETVVSPMEVNQTVALASI